MRKFIYIAFALILLHSTTQGQKLYFNGLGRVLTTNNTLSGGALNNDTTSARKKAAGYFLFDLGINYQPCKSFRVSGTTRIVNQLGGFYGIGNSLLLRQVKIEGIIAKAVKYEVGDLNLALTKYTLYNNDEIWNDYEAEVFAIRRRITNYESFNTGNTWRLQGAHVNSELKFSRGIKSIGIDAFATTNGRYDYFHLPHMDYMMAGGRLGLVQSKYFKVGGNYTGLLNTNKFSFSNYQTNVFTADYKLGFNIDSLEISTYGEGGKSYSNTTSSTLLKGNFYEANVELNQKKWGLKLFGTYRMVDADFRSPGAQTRRIYDSGLPSLFGKVENNTTQRSPGLFDRLSDVSLRNLYIQPNLMPYLLQYNLITPYGMATPNRQGFSFGLTKGDASKFLMADFRADLLKEVTADSGADKRSFVGLRGGLNINLGKAFNWNKNFSLNGGIRYEHDSRSVNPVNFTSTLYDAGLNAELITNFDLLFGYKLLRANGNEMIDKTAINSNLMDGVIGTGVRYRFSTNTFFTLQGNWVRHLNIAAADNYRINQLFLNFTTIF